MGMDTYLDNKTQRVISKRLQSHFKALTTKNFERTILGSELLMLCQVKANILFKTQGSEELGLIKCLKLITHSILMEITPAFNLKLLLEGASIRNLRMTDLKQEAIFFRRILRMIWESGQTPLVGIALRRIIKRTIFKTLLIYKKMSLRLK